MIKKIVVGTRGSLLALAQSNMVVEALKAAHPGTEVEIRIIQTLGDSKQGKPAASKGDKKDWILELEQAVRSGEVNLAVHSGKDVPSDYDVETEIMSVLKREDPRDIFIGQRKEDGERVKWNEVPKNGIIGTASLRRQASVRRLRSDLKLVEHRGNVPTRLTKLEELKELSGIILARAGVVRLGMSDIGFEEFSPQDVMPAVNQGIICVQYDKHNAEVRELLVPIIDQSTHGEFVAERACVALLGADCKSSVSVFAQCEGDFVALSARVMSRDGSKAIEILREKSKIRDAKSLGEGVAKELIKRGASDLLAECRNL